MSVNQNETLFSKTRVVPVLTPVSVESGLGVSRLLFKAGLRVQEITLRTPAGLKTIAALTRELPELIVGAGSVLTPKQGDEALRAGARFLVSPGTSPELLQFAVNCGVPFLPGVATVSEVMQMQSMGCTAVKLFPAQALGGIAFLKSVAGPFPSMKFCPTGGLDGANASSYLALKNVLCVGGSWMVSADCIAAGNFEEIRRRARVAAAL